MTNGDDIKESCPNCSQDKGHHCFVRLKYLTSPNGSVFLSRQAMSNIICNIQNHKPDVHFSQRLALLQTHPVLLILTEIDPPTFEIKPTITFFSPVFARKVKLPLFIHVV